jgi:P-type Na+/K+ transporter
MINMRRSFFRMQPKSKRYFTQWMHDVWRNSFLFWAIVAGFVTMFPIIYIPGLNTVVFKHAPISWEWGIVFIAAVVFFMGIEFWKWLKRVYFRRQARKVSGNVADLETRVFGRYYNMGTGSQDEETGASAGEKVAQ